MLSGREDLPLRHGHVLFAAGHDEDGLLSPHWRLNVGVCLGSKGLDLTAWRDKSKSGLIIKKT